MIIIKKPTFVNPDFPTTAEAAAQALYESQLQTARLIVSPDLVAAFTSVQLPDVILADDGYLGAAEREVIFHSGKTVAEIAALAVGSAELADLVYATQLQIAIRIIPQAAQIVRQGALHSVTQYQPIDWEKRKIELISDYKAKILAVNPAATISISDDLGEPIALLTASCLVG